MLSLRSQINQKIFIRKYNIRFCTTYTTVSNAKKIAILIDGDNAEASLIGDVIAEAGRFGAVTVKRIYGDWTTPQMKSWKEQLNSYAVRPIQKFAYTKAKSSTDTALIIDAMDLLHSKLVDGFCIVSSDSDYTGLAHRIREEGMFIMGIGRSHTPDAFVRACSSFTYTEIFNTDNDASKTNMTRKNNSDAIESIISSGKSIDFDQINKAFRMAVNIDTGQAKLSKFAEDLRKLDPTFDHRNYGYTSFSKFCEALSDQYAMSVDKDGTTVLISEKSTSPTNSTTSSAPKTMKNVI